MFTDLPVVTASPALQFVNESTDPVSIQCNVEAYPEVLYIEWRKVSIEGHTNTTIDAWKIEGKYSIVSSTNTSYLTIYNIVANDDAIYICFATSKDGIWLSNDARVSILSSKLLNIFIRRGMLSLYFAL